MRGGLERTGLRQRGDAGCNRVEEGLPFGVGREQGFAGRFSGGSREDVSVEAGEWCGVRAILSGSARIDSGGIITGWLGLAGGLWARGGAGESVGEESAVGCRISV